MKKIEFDEVFNKIFDKVLDENGKIHLVEKVSYPPIIPMPGIDKRIQKSLNTPNYERSNDIHGFF